MAGPKEHLCMLLREKNRKLYHLRAALLWETLIKRKVFQTQGNDPFQREDNWDIMVEARNNTMQKEIKGGSALQQQKLSVDKLKVSGIRSSNWPKRLSLVLRPFAASYDSEDCAVLGIKHKAPRHRASAKMPLVQAPHLSFENNHTWYVRFSVLSTLVEKGQHWGWVWSWITAHLKGLTA